MDRKKTILIAIAINAGLLIVLCIAAMTAEEDPISERELVQQFTEKSGHSAPLFHTPIETSLAAAAPAPVSPVHVELPVIALPLRTEEPVTHILPPLAKEQAPLAPLPAARANLAPEGVEIVVQKGDSLEKLARLHHTTVDALIKHNHLPSTFLKVGQRLKAPSGKNLPAKEKTTSAPVSDAVEYYTMKVGDNPWSVAMKHHLKLDELLKLNGLNEEKARKLKPGNRIRVR